MAITDNNQTQNSKRALNNNNPLIDDREDFFKDLLTPDLGDDVIIGDILPSSAFSSESFVVTGGSTSRLDKENSKTKRGSSGRSSPSDILLDSSEREKLAEKTITNDQLKSLIRKMPSNMVPEFFKTYVDYIVDDFGINTRERFANFMGQVSAESLRGFAEYVYYTNADTIRSTFSGNSRFSPEQPDKFKYVEGRGDFGFEKDPWDKDGMFDTYYGGRLGNEFNNKSNAESSKTQDIEPGTKFDGTQKNPYNYTKSTDGYAYRGHGIIQITGISKYKKMNELFGKTGKMIKNDVDFVKQPWLVADNPKYAVLSALMFWNNAKNKILYTNSVSLETTRLLTKQVRGVQDTYVQRHRSTLRYYDWLLTGGNIPTSQVYTKTIPVTQLRFYNAYEDPRVKSAVLPEKFQDLFDVTTYSNLSYWESSGEPVPPYKDLNTSDARGRRFPIFGITNNNEARIYKSSEIDSVWSNLKYAAAGFPILLSSGKKTELPKGPLSFLRRTGRTAIGITSSGELVVYVTKSAILEDLQDGLLRQGCVDAINFDGGGSTFLYVNGNVVINSERKFPTIMAWE